MKKYFSSYYLLLILLTITPNLSAKITGPIVIDHQCTKLQQIRSEWIDSAKSKLHIVYGHTSHGSQLITGMNGLISFAGDQFEWNNGGINGALDLQDGGISGASDLGNPNRTAWADATRNYLNNPVYADVNVIIWSWCGQVSSATEEDINTYLNLMNTLEVDFPDVMFVYMTGHLDGSGLMGNLHLRNEQIRNYCLNNNKILYDFADIETWDPDSNFFGDKIPNDNCDYDTDGNGSRDGNWAIEWQNSHIEGVDWYNCPSAHSQSLNANQKAYAAWWLWASLAGWEVATNVYNEYDFKNIGFELHQNYPNPFNPSTTVKYSIPNVGNENFRSVQLVVYDVLGSKVATLVNEKQKPGNYEVVWDAKDYSSGVYFYRIAIRSNKLNAGSFIETRKMLLLK